MTKELYRKLLNIAKRDNRETAVFITEDGVSEIFQGDKNSIDFSGSITPKKEYIVVHAHTMEIPPSFYDLEFLLRRTLPTEIVTITPKRVYRIIKIGRDSREFNADVFTRYLNEDCARINCGRRKYYTMQLEYMKKISSAWKYTIISEGL